MVTVASFGGPLALAGLYVPQAIADVTSSAGLVTVGGVLLFVPPLMVWLRYARHVATAGGLYGFVEEAAGRRVAVPQAALWIVSYLLYLLYTTAYVVYDLLPVVVPGIGPYRTALDVALPGALAAVILGPRTVALIVIGVVATSQLALVGLLGGLAVRHATPAAAFAAHAGPAALAPAAAGTALLFVCGSLPLFLGGEVVHPARTVRRVLPAAYFLTAVAVVFAVLPFAVDPAFTRAPIPGMALVEVDAGHAAGVAVGLGITASVLGVMLVEYLALTRLLHALTGHTVRVTARWVAALLVTSGPVSVLNPQRFYTDLLKPSLVALWLSQLLVVAAYPRFAARRHGRRPGDALLALVAAGVTLFGLWTALAGTTGT